MNLDKPLVSIGLPTYNSSNTISKVLDNIINQTYKNIEIIISDNNSQDETIKIIQNYALKDTRIKIYKSKKNYGVIFNFNKVFLESSGKYFSWFGADDIRDNDFISACVKKLEEDNSYVLCQSITKLQINENNDYVSENSLDSFKNKNTIYETYEETIKNFPATAFYGLIRSESIKKTNLFQKVMSSDLVFIQELSMYGKFVQVNKFLFTYKSRERWNTIDENYLVFFGKNKKPFFYIPFLYIFIFNLKNIIFSQISHYKKFYLIFILSFNLIKYIYKKSFIKIYFSFFRLNKKKSIINIYINFFHNPNVKIINQESYYEKIIKPMLGFQKNK